MPQMRGKSLREGCAPLCPAQVPLRRGSGIWGGGKSAVRPPADLALPRVSQAERKTLLQQRDSAPPYWGGPGPDTQRLEVCALSSAIHAPYRLYFR